MNRTVYFFVFVLSASFMLAGADDGLAAAQNVLNSTATQIMPDPVETENLIIERLSYRYQTEKPVVQQLRRELGSWEEVTFALVIASKAKERADRILAMRKNKLSWDQIMNRFTLIQDDVRDEVLVLLREINRWESAS